MFKIFITTLTVLVATKAFALQLSTATQTEIENIMKEYTKKGRFPGLALGVVALDNGQAQTLYKTTAGVRGFDDKGQALPVETKTLFRVVSISKSVTAMALTSLMKKNNFDWNSLMIDQPSGLTTKLKAFAQAGTLKSPDAWKNIKLNELAGHTSGLGYFYMDLNLVETEGRAETNDEIDAYLEKANFFGGPAGKFIYANEDYNILARLVGGISQQTGKNDSEKFQNYVLTSVLPDLAKNGEVTYNFPRDPVRFSAEVAQGYETASQVGPILYEPNNFSGSAGMAMSIDGLSNYVGQLLQLSDKKISTLPIDSTDFYNLVTPGEKFNVGLGPMVYGKGFYWQNYDKVLSFNHLGIDVYYTAEMVLYPTEGFAIVATTNRGQVVPQLRNLTFLIHNLVSADLNTQRTYVPPAELKALVDSAALMF